METTLADATMEVITESASASSSNANYRLSIRKKVIFAFLAMVFILVVAEIAARIRLASGAVDNNYLYNWYRTKRLSSTWGQHDRDYPYLPYIPKGNANGHSKRGLLLDSIARKKPKNVYRIFCLGGSTTWVGYPHDLSITLQPSFRERGFKLEVINAADISWTSAETLIHFTIRCLPYQPDAIIVYHAVNDCWPAFGRDWSADYSHWRKRLDPPKPFLWDYLPHFLDHSAAFVQFRSWFEIPRRYQSWLDAIARYVPDFDHDPYHGVEPYRRNISNLVAIAQFNGVSVFLATQVSNDDEPRRRLVSAVREVNQITRDIAGQFTDVTLIDAAGAIHGTNALLRDICHFRRDADGQDRLVAMFATSIKSKLDALLALREQRHSHP